MNKEALLEEIVDMSKPEMVDIIDAMKLDIKKNLSLDNMREALKKAIENYSEEDPTVPPEDVEKKQPAAKLDKSIRGKVIGIANVSSGTLDFQVLSVKPHLQSVGVLKVVSTDKKVGDLVDIPVV